MVIVLSPTGFVWCYSIIKYHCLTNWT